MRRAQHSRGLFKDVAAEGTAALEADLEKQATAKPEEKLLGKERDIPWVTHKLNLLKEWESFGFWGLGFRV